MRKIALTVLLVIASAAAQAGDGEPQAQLDALLQRLKGGKYEGALQSLFAGSLALAQKPTEFKALDGQVKAAFEFFGPPTSWEILDTKPIGKDLVNIKMLSKQKDEVPLFWNTLFYRRHNSWEPVGIVFFDDPSKAGIW